MRRHATLHLRLRPLDDLSESKQSRHIQSSIWTTSTSRLLTSVQNSRLFESRPCRELQNLCKPCTKKRNVHFCKRSSAVPRALAQKLTRLLTETKTIPSKLSRQHHHLHTPDSAQGRGTLQTPLLYTLNCVHGQDQIKPWALETTAFIGEQILKTDTCVVPAWNWGASGKIMGSPGRQQDENAV